MIYEIKCADLNNYAPLVQCEGDATPWREFIWDGMPRFWDVPPKIQKHVEKKKKKQKDRADIGYFSVGALVLSGRAYGLLKDYLSPFGQLLQLSCDDGEAWLYNVTNIISCVDCEKSLKVGSAVSQEIFFEDNVPLESSIFKDENTAKKRIYLNMAAKQDLEKILSEHLLTGWKIEPAGISPNY